MELTLIDLTHTVKLAGSKEVLRVFLDFLGCDPHPVPPARPCEQSLIRDRHGTRTALRLAVNSWKHPGLPLSKPAAPEPIGPRQYPPSVSPPRPR